MSDPSRQGRLPKSVYRRRRIAVFSGLIAVLITLVMIVAGPATIAGWFGIGGDSSPGASTPQKPDEKEDSKGDDKAAISAKDEAEEEAKPAEPGPCEPNNLAVEAVTDAVEYGGDELPKLSLRVTNHSAVDCDADLGTKTMVFEIKSGSELYWNSTHCQVDPSKNLVRMQAGQTLETDAIEWDRTRSDPENCEDKGDDAPAGGASYHLAVEIAGVASENTEQFLLY